MTAAWRMNRCEKLLPTWGRVMASSKAGAAQPASPRTSRVPEAYSRQPAMTRNANAYSPKK